jgi:hypothetical protein
MNTAKKFEEAGEGRKAFDQSLGHAGLEPQEPKTLCPRMNTDKKHEKGVVRKVASSRFAMRA